MNELWTELCRISFTSTGYLYREGKSKVNIPCTLWIAQLFNGRIPFEIQIEQEQYTLQARQAIIRYEFFDFIGTLADGTQLVVKQLRVGNTIPPKKTGATLQGYVNTPSYVEILKSQSTELSTAQKVSFEVTNLPLYGLGSIETDIGGVKIEFQQTPDYKKVRSLMSGLKTNGVLCQIQIILSESEVEISEDELNSDFISTLCGLLSISQRSHVSCVAQHWEDENGTILRSRYEEPYFPYSRPSQPLIPIKSLPLFIRTTWENYRAKYFDWNLGQVQDYYLQSMALTSAWPQALGFFTALETLKEAFLKQSDRTDRKNIELIVPSNRFKKAGISSKVIRLLADSFPEFSIYLNTDLDDERELEKTTLKSKIQELNRRAYKAILRKMFQTLKVSVDDRELKKLIDLRNQIIHRGIPDYQGDFLASSSAAFETSTRFGSIIERTVLAILEYQGEYDTYDRVVSFV